MIRLRDFAGTLHPLEERKGAGEGGSEGTHSKEELCWKENRGICGEFLSRASNFFKLWG